MSGEFGDWNTEYGGYMHDKVQSAADDCKARGSRGGELTRLLGDHLGALADLARGVCWFEACDSGYDYPVEAAISALPKLKTSLTAIEEHLKTYRDVMTAAVHDYIKSKMGSPPDLLAAHRELDEWRGRKNR